MNNAGIAIGPILGGALAGGFGLPARHIAEGAMTYLDINLIFITATLVISVISFRAREKRPSLAKWGDRLGVMGLPTATLLSGIWVAAIERARPGSVYCVAFTLCLS